MFASAFYMANMAVGIFIFYLPPALIYIIVAAGAAASGVSGGFLWVSVGGYLR